MATRGGLPNVSYGIGVQNRYSAFLDDEDGFGPLTVAAPAVNSIKIRTVDNSVKPKSSTNVAQKSGTTKINGRGGVATNNAVKQQEAHDKGPAQNNGQRLTKEGDNRRPQQQQQQQQRRVGNNQVPRQTFVNGRNGNSDREGSNATNNRTVRYQSNRNFNHQSNASHQQPKDDNETGQLQGRPQRNNTQRFNARPRQFHTEDKRGGQQQHQQQLHEGQVDGVSGIGVQSNEDEKRRRQQKRALDLRFKDPEKREARRQQQSSNVATEQSGAQDNQVEQAQGDRNFVQRAPRNRRDLNGKPDEAGRNFNGPRNRTRRQEGDQDGGEQQRDGPQNRPNQRDRLPRNRSGFGTGSRNSRSGDDKNQDRQKPIPNFSDKSDFPSLVSQ